MIISFISLILLFSVFLIRFFPITFSFSLFPQLVTKKTHFFLLLSSLHHSVSFSLHFLSFSSFIFLSYSFSSQSQTPRISFLFFSLFLSSSISFSPSIISFLLFLLSFFVFVIFTCYLLFPFFFFFHFVLFSFSLLFFLQLSLYLSLSFPFLFTLVFFSLYVFFLLFQSVTQTQHYHKPSQGTCYKLRCGRVIGKHNKRNSKGNGSTALLKEKGDGRNTCRIFFKKGDF